MLRFPEVMTDSLRICIESTRLDANIMNVAAYYAQPLIDEEQLILGIIFLEILGKKYRFLL